MNYDYQTYGLLRREGSVASRVLDYARFSIKPLNESALDEHAAFDTANSKEEADLARYSDPIVCIKQTWSVKDKVYTCNTLVELKGNAAADLDFNRNGKLEIPTAAKPAPVLVKADIDGLSGTKSIHDGLTDDWNHLAFNGGGSIGAVVKIVRRDLGEPVTCMEEPPPLSAVEDAELAPPTDDTGPQVAPPDELPPSSPTELEPEAPANVEPPASDVNDESPKPEQPASPSEEPAWPSEGPLPPVPDFDDSTNGDGSPISPASDNEPTQESGPLDPEGPTLDVDDE
jgi:hypothetical protein